MIQYNYLRVNRELGIDRYLEIGIICIDKQTAKEKKMNKSLIPNDERIYNRPDKDGNYPPIEDFFNAGTEETKPTKYQGHEVKITGWIGRNVIITRKDGGKLKAVSGLRHHYGKPAVEVDTVTTSPQNIEGWVC